MWPTQSLPSKTFNGNFRWGNYRVLAECNAATGGRKVEGSPVASFVRKKVVMLNSAFGPQQYIDDVLFIASSVNLTYFNRENLCDG